ncbi:hypothetical protein DK37_07465 [Halomonas sp. SUBG004]|nr:hypothetical protein DK37_07465 [Halomonas sp. SUBG004]
MKQQQGAALVIVMVLLASALVMALVSMQTALIDERLAGNFRASIQAQMRSETAALEALARWEELDWQGAPLLDAPETARLRSMARTPKYRHRITVPHHSCFYMPVIYHSRAMGHGHGSHLRRSGR